MYSTLKTIHLCTATLTICGFILRAYWMIAQPELLNRRAVRILPHVNDTLFLLSGIALVFVLKLPVLQQSWLLAKLIALVAYVVLGTIALKRGKTLQQRITAALLAIATFAYIVGVAIYKSPAGWLTPL